MKRFFLSVLLSSALISIKPVTASAQFVNDALLYIGSLLVVVPFHELGHYTVAALGGATDIKVGIGSPDGGTGLAYTSFDPTNLNRFEMAMTALAGSAFSRGLAEATHYGGKKIFRQGFAPNIGQRIFSAVYTVARFDFPLYVVQDAVLNAVGEPGSDIDIFVTQIAAHHTTDRTLVYAGLLGVAAVDILLDWDRISYHIAVANGERATLPKYEAAPMSVRPLFGNGAVGLGFHARF